MKPLRIIYVTLTNIKVAISWVIICVLTSTLHDKSCELKRFQHVNEGQSLVVCVNKYKK